MGNKSVPKGFRVQKFSLHDNGYTEDGFIRLENETIRISRNPKMLIDFELNQVCLAQEFMKYDEALNYCNKRLPEFITNISPVNVFDTGFFRSKKLIWKRIKNKLLS